VKKTVKLISRPHVGEQSRPTTVQHDQFTARNLSGLGKAELQSLNRLRVFEHDAGSEDTYANKAIDHNDLQFTSSALLPCE
jgi:hypothetical protein